MDTVLKLGAVADYVWLLWDLAAVVLIIASIHSCARRGLIRTLLSFLGYFIAAFVAKELSPQVAGFLYGNVVEEALVRAADREMGALLTAGKDMAVAALESFPRLLRQYLPLPVELEMGPYAAMEQRELVEALVDAALREPVLLMLQSVAFFAVFSVVLMVVRLLSRFFNGVNRLPLIGPLNSFLGGVVGLLQAVVFLLVGAFALELVIMFTGDSLFWLNRTVMDQTYIWRVFYTMATG